MRHPVDAKGGMAQSATGWIGWAMFCDRCGYRSDVRPSQHDLPLDEFRADGWFVAKVHGDLCSKCKATA